MKVIAAVAQPRRRRHSSVLFLTVALPLQLLLLSGMTTALVSTSCTTAWITSQQWRHTTSMAAEGVNGSSNDEGSSKNAKSGSSSSSSSSNDGPANLIDKALFVEAVESLKAASDPTDAATTTKQIVGPDAPNGEISTSKKDTTDGEDASTKKDTFYAIGKVSIKLDVSTGNPGMDLAEAENGLVLISSVTGLAAEAGLQTGDTIVFVEAVDAVQDTKAYNLEDTARVLMGAMKLAFNAGEPEIVLVVNRLFKMKYA
jgi:hypothetical protein